MYTVIDVIVFSILGFGVGIAFTITASFVNRRFLEEVELPTNSSNSEETELAPFIEIHHSIIDRNDDSSKVESMKRLKEKIENFKHRNKFYKSYSPSRDVKQ